MLEKSALSFGKLNKYRSTNPLTLFPLTLIHNCRQPSLKSIRTRNQRKEEMKEGMRKIEAFQV